MLAWSAFVHQENEKVCLFLKLIHNGQLNVFLSKRLTMMISRDLVAKKAAHAYTN